VQTQTELFRFDAKDIICKSIKIKSVHEGCSCRLSPRRRGEDKGEGLDLSSSGVGCLAATLTLPLSLAKGEATHAGIMSSLHQKSLSCL
jgi:hypothetical protein